MGLVEPPEFLGVDSRFGVAHALLQMLTPINGNWAGHKWFETVLKGHLVSGRYGFSEGHVSSYVA